MYECDLFTNVTSQAYTNESIYSTNNHAAHFTLYQNLGEIYMPNKLL